MTQSYIAYAVDWLPPPATMLDHFGCYWTGWCPDAGRSFDPTPTLARLRDMAGMSVEMGGRGLHASLVPAFMPAATTSIYRVKSILEEIALSATAVTLPKLSVQYRKRQLVLAPADMSVPANKLMAELRAALLPRVHWRGDLTPGGFALALTGQVDASTSDEVEAGLAPRMAPVLDEHLAIREIALMGNPGGGRPWGVLESYPLSGPAPSVRRQPAGMDCDFPQVLLPFAQRGGVECYT